MKKLELLSRYFKVAVLTVLSEVKMLIMNENTGNFSRKTKNMKRESSENSRTEKQCF